MVDETVAVLASIAVGIAGGFLSSWMAFNASGESFSGRKHGNALIVGALSGLGLGLTATVADPETMATGQFLLTLGLTFLSAVGIDRLRSSGSHMVAKSTEKKEAEKELPK
jgi:hypothetical protein